MGSQGVSLQGMEFEIFYYNPWYEKYMLILLLSY
jgi:hypothetical protein